MNLCVPDCQDYFNLSAGLEDMANAGGQGVGGAELASVNAIETNLYGHTSDLSLIR